MMKKKVLSFEERLKHDGATHVFEITHEDLTETTADTTQALVLLTTPASRGSVECKKTVLVTPLKDASDEAFNTNALIVGDSGSTNRLLASMELNENGSEVLKKVGTGTKYVYTSATAVNAIFAAMSAKALSDIDTGEVHIYLCVEED
jgi:hypothetical protein